MPWWARVVWWLYFLFPLSWRRFVLKMLLGIAAIASALATLVAGIAGQAIVASGLPPAVIVNNANLAVSELVSGAPFSSSDANQVDAVHGLAETIDGLLTSVLGLSDGDGSRKAALSVLQVAGSRLSSRYPLTPPAPAGV